jgi:hypothetical protein
VTKAIPKSCQQRHHSYPSDEAGAACLGCGKKRGSREPRALGASGVQGLRAALGVSQSAPPPEQQQSPPAPEPIASAPAPAVAPPAAELEPSKASEVIWPTVAHWGTNLFQSGVEWGLEKRKRLANDPQPETRAKFEKCLAVQLGIWFPDVQAGPLGQLLLAGFLMAGEMAWNAEKIAAPEPPARAVPGAQTPPPAENESPGAAPAAATDQEQALLRIL